MSTAIAKAVPSLTPDFKQRVGKLVERRDAAAQSYKEAKLALLDFCRDYAELYNDAKTRAAKEYLAKQTGLTESTIRSTLKSIGEHHSVLRKHLALLPASQEGIKAISVALKRHPNTIDILKTKNVLVSGAEASVSGIRTGIRKFVIKKKKKVNVIDVSPLDDANTTEYAIGIATRKRAEVVAALAKLLSDKSLSLVLTVKDVPLREDVKQALGPQWLKTHGARLV